MKLSIVIVNYKNLDIMRLCLRSILNSDIPGEYEILVIDSEAEKESQETITDEFLNVRYAPVPYNTGYSKGVNIGLANSLGEKILILNPDTVVKKDSISRLMEFLDQNPDVGLVGPRLLNFDGTFQQSAFRFYKPLNIIYRRTFLGKTKFGSKALDYFTLQDIDLAKPAEVDWLTGSALMTTSLALKKVGLLDEKLFLYFSDVDWAKRFLQKGYKIVYYPISEIFHYHQRESKSKWGILDPIFNKKTRWHLKDAVNYFLKYR